MNKNFFVRFSGWALVIGTATFFSMLIQITLEETNLLPKDIFGPGIVKLLLIGGFVVGPLLLSFGFLGIYLKFSEKLSKVGKFFLLIGALGGAVSLFGGIWDLLSSGSDLSFSVFAYGFLVVFSSLFMFGVISLRNKSLPRWNSLALLAGIWIPVGIIRESNDRLYGRSWLSTGDLIFLIALGLGTASLILYGFLVNSSKVQLSEAS